MRSNVGTIDKIVRIILAAVLAYLSYTGKIGWWGYAVAIIPLVTGVIGWCPIYASAGMSTVKSK